MKFQPVEKPPKNPSNLKTIALCDRRPQHLVPAPSRSRGSAKSGRKRGTAAGAAHGRGFGPKIVQSPERLPPPPAAAWNRGLRKPPSASSGTREPPRRALSAREPP